VTRTFVRAAARLLAAGSLTLAASSPTGASAQSVLERSPNLSGGWVGAPGRIHFNFLHRFEASPAPARKVGNAPSFLLAYGVGGYGLVGVHYTTNSTLVPGHPNEWEVLARYSPLSSAVGAVVDLGVTGAFNEAAESVDGELAVGVPFGPVKAMGAARYFSDWHGSGDSRWAIGGGLRIRLHDNVALSGDLVTLTSSEEDEDYGWGAAIQLAIPYTPHSLSLQAANTNSATLQGSSIASGGTRYGFEFTIPITLARFFGSGGSAPPPDARTQGRAELVASDTVRVVVREFEFSDSEVTVRPGTYVVWVNEGEIAHSSTADDDLWDSRLLAPGESYGRVFSEVGSHPYHCAPHPFMTGVVTVAEGEDP
jgi:plastocyanin